MPNWTNCTACNKKDFHPESGSNNETPTRCWGLKSADGHVLRTWSCFTGHLINSLCTLAAEPSLDDLVARRSRDLRVMPAGSAYGIVDSVCASFMLQTSDVLVLPCLLCFRLPKRHRVQLSEGGAAEREGRQVHAQPPSVGFDSGSGAGLSSPGHR